MKCENCGKDEQLYEMLGYKNCEDCLMEYWNDNKLEITQSFADFVDSLRKCIETSKGEKK